MGGGGETNVQNKDLLRPTSNEPCKSNFFKALIVYILYEDLMTKIVVLAG